MTKIKLRQLKAMSLSVLIAISSQFGMAQTIHHSSPSKDFSSGPAPALEKSQLQIGRRYYVSTDDLNLRSSNSTSGKNIVGKLYTNDVVELYDSLNEATPLVQVKVISATAVKTDNTSELFVSKDYLSQNPIINAATRYFVIQNVATEKTRVYERCFQSPGCPHKLVMETDMVVGRPEEGTPTDPHAFKTWLGHSKISEWVKFYQDGLAHYPHWYRAGQDLKSIPGPITDGVSKIIRSRKWMVDDAEGKKTIYGAFGWYAAKVTPADEVDGMNYQWMHGTIGWGKDEAAAIKLTRGFILNFFGNPGSSGCTRLENRAISYMRHILPPGTDIFRVYARESTREKEVIKGRFKKKVTPLPRYADRYEKPYLWRYVLLTDGAQQSDGLTADAQTIRENRVLYMQGVNLIESGIFKVDRYPNPVHLDYGASATSGKSGDRYEIDSKKRRKKGETNFRGYFLVDEGRFVDYQHPTSEATKGVIHVSGLLNFRTLVPEFLATTGNHNPPEIQFIQNNKY